MLVKRIFFDYLKLNGRLNEPQSFNEGSYLRNEIFLYFHEMAHHLPFFSFIIFEWDYEHHQFVYSENLIRTSHIHGTHEWITCGVIIKLYWFSNDVPFNEKCWRERKNQMSPYLNSESHRFSNNIHLRRKYFSFPQSNTIFICILSFRFFFLYFH